jgi:hypothetical protein
MKDIRIGPRGQMVALVAVLGGIGAAVARQLPELQRYLKIRSM